MKKKIMPLLFVLMILISSISAFSWSPFTTQPAQGEEVSIYSMDIQEDGSSNPDVLVSIASSNYAGISGIQKVNIECFYITPDNPYAQRLLEARPTFVASAFGREGTVTSNCVVSEDHVNTIESPLGVNDDKTYILRPRIPKSGDTLADGTNIFNSNGDYLLFCGAFKQCGEGHIALAAKEVEIAKSSTTSEPDPTSDYEWDKDEDVTTILPAFSGLKKYVGKFLIIIAGALVGLIAALVLALLGIVRVPKWVYPGLAILGGLIGLILVI